MSSLLANGFLLNAALPYQISLIVYNVALSSLRLIVVGNTCSFVYRLGLLACS